MAKLINEILANVLAQLHQKNYQLERIEHASGVGSLVAFRSSTDDKEPLRRVRMWPEPDGEKVTLSCGPRMEEHIDSVEKADQMFPEMLNDR